MVLNVRGSNGWLKISGVGGVISNFKDDSKKPYGTMELIHTRDVVEKIKELLNYDGMKRFHTLQGEKISAQLIYDLVRI